MILKKLKILFSNLHLLQYKKLSNLIFIPSCGHNKQLLISKYLIILTANIKNHMDIKMNTVINIKMR